MKAKRQHPASNCIIIIFIQITSNDTGTLILEITPIGTLFGFIGILYGCPKVLRPWLRLAALFFIRKV